MTQVTIHRRDVAVDPADPEGLKPALRVTYSTETFAPRFVYVPGEAPTDEEIAATIRQDFAAREAEPSSTLEV